MQSLEGGVRRPGLCLTVGVTGHRDAPSADAAGRIDAMLATLADAARTVAARETWAFAAVPAKLRLVSALAAGADQVTARAALGRGYALHLLLPMPRDCYLADFDAASREAFDALAAQAMATLELPAVEGGVQAAFAQSGRATVAMSDVVVALWDGLPARGPGGTADVIDFAVRRGMPVIHVPSGGGVPRILWSEFEGAACGLHNRDDVPSRPATPESITQLVEQLLAPPNLPDESASLRIFYEEHERIVRPRVAFPLLLWAFGMLPLNRVRQRMPRYADSAAEQWTGFHSGRRVAGHDSLCGFAGLETLFAWADGLANHYGQAYRSGLVLNFLCAAGAVLVALLGLLLPSIKIWLLLAELAVICVLIVNTHIGLRDGWHRRWLEYRFLAEQLRPMRSLRLLALAIPSAQALGERRAAVRWTEWLAGAAWREIGCLSGRIDTTRVQALAAHVAAQEIEPQLQYHLRNANRMHELDHRLHIVGSVLFVATVVVCATFLIGLLAGNSIVKSNLGLLTVLTAGLPALGSALFGIRGQADFIAAAHRSQDTAKQLTPLVERLRSTHELSRTALLAEEAARAMLTDLGQWRLSFRERQLAIPA